MFKSKTRIRYYSILCSFYFGQTRKTASLFYHTLNSQDHFYAVYESRSLAGSRGEAGFIFLWANIPSSSRWRWVYLCLSSAWVYFVLQAQIYQTCLANACWEAGACLSYCVCVWAWFQYDLYFWQPLLDYSQIKMASTPNVNMCVCVRRGGGQEIVVWWMPQIMTVGFHRGEAAQPNHITLKHTHTLSWM